jgi:hypothetical protein
VHNGNLFPLDDGLNLTTETNVFGNMSSQCSLYGILVEGFLAKLVVGPFSDVCLGRRKLDVEVQSRYRKRRSPTQCRSRQRPAVASSTLQGPDVPRTCDRRHVADRASLAGMGNEGKPLVARGTYSLPEELARHAPRERFAPGELRGACREAGEELGREDARKAKFRTAAQMVEMWRGLDLPAWEAPYVLRDARLGYLNGYERALASGEMSERQIGHAAESRWGERWRERLRAARERYG